MANVPNIPSVVVTIEDKSYVQPILNSGRTVLIPFFSKYGDESIQTWATWDEFQSKFGAANPYKYGMAQIYIKGASQFTQSFLGKRLLPSDATFANIEFAATETDLLEQSVTATDETAIKEFDKAGIAIYGSGRGEGYNDIVVKFRPLEEYTRFYADENGIPKYSFNFLEATIYERQNNGSLVQIDQNPVPFALVDIDPETGATIKDIYDNSTLNAEERFETISNYVKAFVNENDVDGNDLTKYLGPNDVEDLYILWDAAAEKGAYIVFEDGDLTIEYIDGITAADVNDTDPASKVRSYILFSYVDDNGDTKYARMIIDNGEIKLAADTDDGTAKEKITIFSSKAFYELRISEKGNFLADDTQEYLATAKSGQTTISVPFDATNAAVIVNDVVLETSEYSINTNTIMLSKPLNYGDSIKVLSASQTTDPAAILSQFKFERYNLWKYLIENEISLKNGSDGANLYLNGTLNFDGPGVVGAENAKMLLIDFYSTNPELREVLYPQYDFDYIPDFTGDPDVQAAIVNLCDYLQTALGIHSTGVKYNYKQDIDYRKYNLGISSFCNMLYSGEANKRHYDSDLGRTLVMPSNYYALLDHLYVDGALDIAEPVAGIDKGSIRTGSIKLTYTPTTLEIEKLRQKQINAIIDEPDGVYFIDQLTMYKKASILSRAHAIKPIMKIKKDIRKLLKDVLQSKDGRTASNRVETIIDSYMKDKVYDAQKNRGGWIEYYKYDIIFDENKLEIQVLLTIKPLRSVEKVKVTIGVV